MTITITPFLWFDDIAGEVRSGPRRHDANDEARHGRAAKGLRRRLRSRLRPQMRQTPWWIYADRPIVASMNPPVGDEHSVGQLRNDVDSIYDILGDIKGTVDNLSVVVDRHSATLDEHSTILDEHTLKLDQIIDLLHAK